MSTEKKMFIGRVKNVKPYPEGRTSLLVVVNQIGPDRVAPYHCNLCIESADVAREMIKYASLVGFEALSFQQWRAGQDRFLGTRQSNDKAEKGGKYDLPALSTTPHPKLGKLGEWADVDYLVHAGLDPDSYLKSDVTPIFSLVGFNPQSVALHENFKPLVPARLVAQAKAEEVFEAEQQSEVIVTPA